MRASLLAGGLLLTTGCSAGVADGLRPDDPTYAGAIGASLEIGERPRVLVVDWEPDARVDLEVAMKQGVAVIAYSGETLRVLDCRMDGDYSFLGTTRKERVVRLVNRDEVVANLPFSGAGLAARLEAEFARGTTLDVAMVMVGKRTTAARRAFRDQLEGDCEAATHIVRGATVGAFAMATGTQAKIRTAAELFGVGAGAQSTSAKEVRTTDGDFASCKDADPDGDAPPKQCGSPVRLDLAPVVAGSSASSDLDAPPAQTAGVAEDVCPKGTVLTDGKCAALVEGGGYVCNWKDHAECVAQCDRGNAGSCLNLGFEHERGIGVAIDSRKAFAAYQRSCDLGLEDGCRAVAFFRLGGIGVPKDTAKAIDYYRPACAAGDAAACSNLGGVYAHGTGVAKDLGRAAQLYTRACNGGHARGCVNLGQVYALGDGLPKDFKAAAKFFDRACIAEHPAGCSNLAQLYDAGSGVAVDHEKSRQLYMRACRFSGHDACVELGIRHDNGDRAPKDAKLAVQLFSRACEVNNIRGCANLGLMLLEGRGTPKDEAGAAKLFARTCGESGLGCDTLGELYAKGIGVAKDRQRAKQILDAACSGGDKRSCTMRKSLGL